MIFYFINIMFKSQRAIINQYKKYRDELDSYLNESDWIRDYGFYLFMDDQINIWYGLVIGPENSLYTGSLLLVRITFPADFPFSPPKIENLLAFPKQFNSNLWSANVMQSLMCPDGEYRKFYGLICMDILNTPHSKIANNQEVYDKSVEKYTPLVNISSIMLSIRSNILGGETKFDHIGDLELKYLLLRYLTFGVLNNSYIVDSTEQKLLLKKLLKQVCNKLFQLHQSVYLQIITELDQQPEYQDKVKELRYLYQEVTSQNNL